MRTKNVVNQVLAGAIVLIASFLGVSTSNAEPFKLPKGEDSWYLGKHVSVMEDPQKILTIEEVENGQLDDQFRANESDIINFGFTGSAYWVKIVLENTEPSMKEWYLGVEYSLLDFIDLYYRAPDGSLVERLTGDRRPFDNRELKHRYFYFSVDLPANEVKTFYLRVQSEGAAEIPIVLKSPRHFAAINHEQQFGQGLFVGLLVIMIAYNLSLAFGSKQPDYFLYAFFISSLLIFKGTMNGVTQEYLWRDWVEFANLASAFSTPLVFLSATIYAWFFLDVKQYKRWNLIYKFFTAVLTLLMVGSFFLPYSMIKFSTMIGMISALSLVISSSYIWMKGFRPALFFLSSFLLLITGSLVYGLQKLGIIPVSFLTLYCVEITSALQAILLSIAQVDKINQINRAFRKAQREKLEAEEALRSKLEVMVEQRTADLWQKTQEIKVMMDNLEQGICTIDDALNYSGEYSKHLETVLKQKDLENTSVEVSLLSKLNLPADDISKISTAIQSVIGEDVFNFEGNSHVFPRSVEANIAGERRYLELEWAPIENQDAVITKVLLTVRDVTEIEAMKAAAERKEEELKLVGQVLKLSPVKFQSFIQGAFHLLDTCRSIVAKDYVSKQEWNVLLRNIHTIKGNARTYDFDQLASIVHSAEDVLFNLDGSSLSQKDILAVDIALNDVQNCLDRYQVINDVKLERNIAGEAESVIVDMADLLRKLAQDGSLSKYLKDPTLPGILKKIEALSADTFQGAIHQALSSAPKLAVQLGKAAPAIRFSGEDFKIDKRHSAPLEEVFVHLVRNSIDHGFSKTSRDNSINIEVIESAGFNEIHYYDSGRGLNIEKLRTKAVEKKLIQPYAPLSELAQLIFVSGISSAEKVTEVSGRGVGMDAVKGFIEDLGGEAKVVLTEDQVRVDGFIYFKLVMKLPVESSKGLSLVG